MLLKLLRYITIWIALGAAGVLVVSAIFEPETLPKLQLCSFKQYTGHPCPGCGLTRSFCAISHGRFGDALHFNPFGFIFYAAVISIALWPILTHFFPKLKIWFDQTNAFAWGAPITFGLMILFGIIRIFTGPNV
ncbi:MAG: DUF2752 domain-containing protein [Planctomycetota bacterium]